MLEIISGRYKKYPNVRYADLRLDHIIFIRIFWGSAHQLWEEGYLMKEWQKVCNFCAYYHSSIL